MSAPDFVAVQSAAELAVLRMALIATLQRHAAEDQEIQGISVAARFVAHGAIECDVELLGAAGFPVGGFSL
ncbi:hypothetical protein [Roseateles sp. PN1]|uniref:hypothetical protein n=1 Tax=Roseateles sp. PN1 TaxID=3137372 RepID=UPI00313A2C8A